MKWAAKSWSGDTNETTMMLPPRNGGGVMKVTGSEVDQLILFDARAV